MIKWLIIILLVVLFVYFIYLIIHCKQTNALIKLYFKESSVIVYGPKGSGKDLLFQKVIYLRRNEKYLANITYGYKGEVVPIKQLSVAPNNFENFIKGDVVTIKKNDDFEGVDYFLSDAGVFLPAQYNSILTKNYFSLPIYYALSRHLYLQNIHLNSQYLNRAWNMLREQADKFIRCVGKTKLLFGIIAKIRMYDKYESAAANLLPMKKPKLFDKVGRAMYNQYYATNGEIKTRLYYIRKKHIKYDTRIFHKVIFGITAKEWLKQQKKKQ